NPPFSPPLRESLPIYESSICPRLFVPRATANLTTASEPGSERTLRKLLGSAVSTTRQSVLTWITSRSRTWCSSNSLPGAARHGRSEEHTSELQSPDHL